MKNYKYLLVAVLCLVAASCKKSHDATTQAAPVVDSFRIATAVFTFNGDTTESLRFIYDSSTRLDSELYDNGTLLKFIYYTGYTLIKAYDPHGTLITIGRYNTDGLGNIVLANTDTTGVPYQYTYNGMGHITNSEQGYEAGAYAWDHNGNLDTASYANAILYYTYDLSKKGQPGDMLSFGDFRSYGKRLMKTTNLPVTETHIYSSGNQSFNLRIHL